MIPITPYEQRQLSLYVEEHGAPAWSGDTTARLLDLIAASPWRPVTEMQAHGGDPCEPYARARALAMFLRERSLSVQTGEDLALDGSLVNHNDNNVARLSMMRAVLETRPVADLVEHLAAMIEAMPTPHTVTASADHDQLMFVRERKLSFLPDIVGQIGWIHVFCPRVYPAYFDRAVLLAAPCHRVEERSDGTIWMWGYEHPLRYDPPEVRDAIAELHGYLGAHAKKRV